MYHLDLIVLQLLYQSLPSSAVVFQTGGPSNLLQVERLMFSFDLCSQPVDKLSVTEALSLAWPRANVALLGLGCTCFFVRGLYFLMVLVRWHQSAAHTAKHVHFDLPSVHCHVICVWVVPSSHSTLLQAPGRTRVVASERILLLNKLNVNKSVFHG